MGDLWGSIAISEWHAVSCVAGRPATGDDVAAGSAVYVPGGSTAASMALSCYAIQSLEDGPEQLVVLMQAELVRRCIILGVHLLYGGNSICMATKKWTQAHLKSRSDPVSPLSVSEIWVEA